MVEIVSLAAGFIFKTKHFFGVVKIINFKWKDDFLK